MAVGFRIDFLWYQVGHGDFFHSFFSTVCHHLEEGRWGTKYPYLMNKLYQGCLEWEDVRFAREELTCIRNRLSKLAPSEVVWDIDDLTKRPPWGDAISNDITDLSNYFVTSDGRDLISIIFQVFDEAETEKHKIEIISL